MNSAISHATMGGTLTLRKLPRSFDHGSSEVLPVDERLAAHLTAWLGAWPPAEPVQIIVWPERDRPGWDGGTWLGLGVESPHGTVLSLSPRLVADPDAIDRDLLIMGLREPDPSAALAAAFARRDVRLSRSVFRWSDRPAPLPDVGEWVLARDPRLPRWLQAFNDEVLVAWDGGQVAAGVGRKWHNRFGQELAVGTDAAHRGRGLARALVAQAARRVLAEGAVPLYFHHPANGASARVAEAAGFPDRGWHVVGIVPS